MKLQPKILTAAVGELVGANVGEAVGFGVGERVGEPVGYILNVNKREAVSIKQHIELMNTFETSLSKYLHQKLVIWLVSGQEKMKQLDDQIQ